MIGLTGALVVGPAVLPVVLGVLRLAAVLLGSPALVASLMLGPGVPWMVRLRPGLTHRGWIGSDSDDWDFSRLFFGEGIRMHPLSPKAEKEVQRKKFWETSE